LVDNLGFSQCDVDQSIFFKINGSDLTLILMHINDCTIVAMSLMLVDWVKKGIREHVKITDLGKIHWLLGIKVKRDHEQGKVMLSQWSYIDASL
jgi:hypothetical protein